MCSVTLFQDGLRIFTGRSSTSVKVVAQGEQARRPCERSVAILFHSLHHGTPGMIWFPLPFQ